MALFPRFHLFEIEDQSWCPEFVVKFIQTYLTALWNFRIPAVRHTAAEAAANIILENLPDASLYTFIDPYAGAGGPVPAIEKALGTEYSNSVQFILADIKPRVEEWKAIKKEQKNISFIQGSVDAQSWGKLHLARSAGYLTFRFIISMMLPPNRFCTVRCSLQMHSFRDPPKRSYHVLVLMCNYYFSTTFRIHWHLAFRTLDRKANNGEKAMVLPLRAYDEAIL
ncbi:hypothetical protein COH21_012685 [Aspergillus flavus]|nr:hypothetical protein COH21_012685 [Aspergillus flavus]